MTYTLDLKINPETGKTELLDSTDYGPLGLLVCDFKIYNSADLLILEVDDYDPSSPYVFDKVPDGIYRIEYYTSTTVLSEVTETHYKFIAYDTIVKFNDKLIKWADPNVVCCKEFPYGLAVLYNAVQIALDQEKYDRCELILYRVNQELDKICPGC